MIRPGSGAVTAAYFKHRHGRWLLFWGLIAVMTAVAAYAVTQGSYRIAMGDVLRVLAGKALGAERVVIANIRLPRVVSAVVCGWGLSLAGLCFQSLLRNPLASPITLGISHGAAFGAALSIVVFGTRVVSATTFAFGGAMTATLVILILARIRMLSPEAIILSGVALSSLFSSATILIQYLATETELAMVVFWTFGDVARSNWREIAMLTVVVLSATALLVGLRWDLNALSSDGDAAKGLGVSVEKIRAWGMVAATLVAALATAFHGVIAFIGLIAPHMARRLVGDDHGLLIPFSAILGALLLLAADTVGRVLIGSGSLPVGVITSFLGAPIFLFLLVRGYR